jgi:8-hydroxy-5-deazaflavin:NADPH oxidoreductase
MITNSTLNSKSTLPTIAVLGGTGKEGKGLVFRWARAGYRVVIGSRTPAKAVLTKNELLTLLGGKASIEAASTVNASMHADIIVLAVPYEAQRLTLEEIKDFVKGKILIDVTVPLVPPQYSKVQMPPAGSAAQEACEILGDEVQVTTAFQSISYRQLLSKEPIDSDVLVTGTNERARSETLKLVSAAGLTGWDAGPIENSVVVEGITSILIGINKKYGSKSAGIKIIGVPPLSPSL